MWSYQCLTLPGLQKLLPGSRGTACGWFWRSVTICSLPHRAWIRGCDVTQLVTQLCHSWVNLLPFCCVGCGWRWCYVKDAKSRRTQPMASLVSVLTSLYWSCRKRVRYKDQLTAEDTYQWWRWWHRESSFAKHLEVHVHNLESLGRLGCIWNGKMLLVGLKLSCNKWQNIPHCSEQFVSSQNQSCWNIIVIVYLWIRRQTFQQIYIYIYISHDSA